MKYGAFILFLITPIWVFAQVSKKCIVVNSTSKTPLPYANILTKNKTIGCYADDKGSFNPSIFSINDTLIIRCVGYESFQIPVSKISTLILLVPRVEQLRDVVVVSESLQEKVIPFVSKKRGVGLYGRGAIEMVTRVDFLRDDASNQKAITQIGIRIKGYSADNPCRLHLYEANGDGEPGEEMLREDIILSQKQLRGNDVVVQIYSIYTYSKSVFIGVEWISDKYNMTNTTYESRANFIKPKVSFTTRLNEARTYIRTLGQRDWVLMNMPLMVGGNPTNLLVSLKYK